MLDSKIELIFLPPYAPSLNLIERYWRFFKKKGSVALSEIIDTFM
ncbi:transposase [Nitrosomonas aestuarii]